MSSVENPFGVGRVKIPVVWMSVIFHRFLIFRGENALIKERFNYDKLSTDQNSYNDYTFDKIIFAEGTGIKENPYFCEIPVKPNKGHRFSLRLEKIQKLL